MIPMKKKADDEFLDGVVGDMGNEDGSTEYGADMTDESEGGDETSNEDQLVAARQVAKALGMPAADAEKLRDALKAFNAACM